LSEQLCPSAPASAELRPLPPRILEIVEHAEQRFQCGDVMQPASSGVNPRARAWAIRRCYEEGFGLDEIAEHFQTTTAAVKAILHIPPSTETDEDERDDVPIRAPSRMLPVHGERRPCANEAECLEELLRACRPVAPRYASCPSNCGSFAPPLPNPLPSRGERFFERCPAAPDKQAPTTRRPPTRTKHARRPGDFSSK